MISRIRALFSFLSMSASLPDLKHYLFQFLSIRIGSAGLLCILPKSPQVLQTSSIAQKLSFLFQFLSSRIGSAESAGILPKSPQVLRTSSIAQKL